MHTRKPQLEGVLAGRRSNQILTKERPTFVYSDGVADVFDAWIIGCEREMLGIPYPTQRMTLCPKRPRNALETAVHCLLA